MKIKKLAKQFVKQALARGDHQITLAEVLRVSSNPAMVAAVMRKTGKHNCATKRHRITLVA